MANISNSKSNTLISGTSDDDTIRNGRVDDSGRRLGGSNVSIDSSAGNDWIQNTGSNVTINAGKGKDIVHNEGKKVTINGGDGSDYIQNGEVRYSDIAADEDSTDVGTDVIINGGASKDFIYNGSSRVTINGGAGKDDIRNYADSVSISGGTGDDTISNEGSNVTIRGGAGNDYIYLNEDGVTTKIVIQYALGDVVNSSYDVSYDDGVNEYRSEVVYGYNPSDTVKLIGESVTGCDFYYGEGLTLYLTSGYINFYGTSCVNVDGVAYGDTDNTNFESNTTLNYNGEDKFINGGSNVLINLKNGSRIENYGDNVTIKGGKGEDGVENYVSNVSISGGAGNDGIHNYEGNNVTIDSGTGNDYIYNRYGNNAFINAGDGDDEIYSYGSNVLIDGGSGNDYIDGSGTEATINGGSGNDTIYGGLEVTIDGGAGNDKLDGGDGSIDGGAGNDTIDNHSWSGGCTLTGGDGSDLFIYDAEAYSWSDVSNDIITDYAEEDTIQFNNAIDKISTNSAGSVIFTVGKNKLVVKNVADKIITYIDSDGNTKTYGKKWTLDGSTATYGSLVVKGVTSLEGLSVSKKIVTVSAASLGTDKISVSDGYTLALGSDVSASTTKNKWSLKNSTATYKQTTTAGYSLDGNAITYTKKSSKTLATVKGVTSLDGLSVSKKIVTVSAASLGTEKISVSDGYTLKLGSDVSSASTKKSWTLKNSTATYKQTTTAGYSLENNEIIYSKKSSKTLATVTGVKSLDGLSVNKKIVTVSAASLGTEKISVSDGYSLALGDDVKASTTKNSWTLKNSTATYKQITSAGYSLVDNEIIYSKKSSKTLATVKGVTSTDGLNVSGKTIKLSGDALSKKVTVSGDYVFDFASDFKNATITGSSSNDIIIARGKNIFVTGGAGSDIFALKPTVANVISDYDSTDKISLLSGAADFSVSGGDLLINGKVTLKGAAEKIVTYIEDGAEKIFGRDGNDTLIVGKGNDSLSGGAGDDSLWGSAGTDTLRGGDGSDIFVYKAGDGKIIIEDFEDAWDKIRVLSGSVDVPESDGKDVTFAVDDGQIIIKGGASKYIPIYYGEGNKNIVQKYISRS